MTRANERLAHQDGLTAGQRATLSNTICGELACAQDLERMGLLRIRQVSRKPEGDVAFFDLTELGEEFVERHYVIPDTKSLSPRRN
jgi:hypothetical protein